jgi:outer membrane protein assembly factor BamB
MSMRPFRLLPRTRRGRLVLAGLAILSLAGVALAGYLYEKHRTGSIYHPHARFLPQQVPPPLPKKGPSRFAWPLYGYSKDHTRFFGASSHVRPPFKRLWSYNEGGLLELPPVMYENRIFQLGDDATLHTIDKYTGHQLWSRKLGALSASSPAVGGDAVYATVLSRAPSLPTGRVVALATSDGRERWSRDLPSRCESSPLLDHDKLFFGTEDGTVYALDARTGHTLWTYRAAGAVKASPTLSNGVLYFGDYAGDVQAVRERDGHRLWRSGSGGALLGSGTFYSTAAVVYGRVYLGNTDGRVYAYDQYSGKLDWAVQTGAYVYASPAVANAPNVGPTIYLGSYDGTFYALGAQSGHIRWQHRVGGRISGSATIVGRTVYFADLGEHRTIGMDISTGQVVYRNSSGAFDPVITDGHNIYLTGYSTLEALQPDPPVASHPRARSAAHRVARSRASRARAHSHARSSRRPTRARARSRSARRHAPHRHARH